MIPLEAKCAFVSVVSTVAETVEECVNGFLLVKRGVKRCRRWRLDVVVFDLRWLRRGRDGQPRSTAALSFAIARVVAVQVVGGQSGGKW
jgi:hypothetical protein